MNQIIQSRHGLDEHGAPAGGYTVGTGIEIQWQNGPLGRDDLRIEPNGAFVEGVITAALDRLQFYQQGKFACPENAKAIAHLDAALSYLNARTKNREAREVEGTHEP